MNQLFNLGDVFLRHASQAECVRRLAELVLQPVADDGFAEAGLFERQAERCGLRTHQQMVQETDGEAGFWIERLFTEQPVDLDEGLLRVLALARGVRLDDASRLGEKLLSSDRAVHFATIELVEERRQNFQAFLHVVVAVEPHARVARMIKLGVEFLKLGKRQLGNHRGVAARVHAVRVVRKKRLLALAREHGIRR